MDWKLVSMDWVARTGDDTNGDVLLIAEGWRIAEGKR